MDREIVCQSGDVLGTKVPIEAAFRPQQTLNLSALEACRSGASTETPVLDSLLSPNEKV